MIVSPFRRFTCLWLAVLLGIGALACCDRTIAAEGDAVIKPYTGPPIYLDEPPAAVDSTLVERTTFSDKYPNGQVRYEREIARFSDDHRESDGFYREYYENGQLFAEGQFVRGRQHGDWTFYYDNGKVNRKVTYAGGLPEGSVEVRREDGTLMTKRNFEKGQRTGEWTFYDDTGERVLREQHYMDGKADGVWKVWYPSGQLQRQLSFENGRQVGPMAEWNEDGSQRMEATYADGVPDGASTIWLKDGRKIVRQFAKGKLISEVVE